MEVLLPHYLACVRVSFVGEVHYIIHMVLNLKFHCTTIGRDLTSVAAAPIRHPPALSSVAHSLERLRLVLNEHWLAEHHAQRQALQNNSVKKIQKQEHTGKITISTITSIHT